MTLSDLLLPLPSKAVLTHEASSIALDMPNAGPDSTFASLARAQVSSALQVLRGPQARSREEIAVSFHSLCPSELAAASKSTTSVLGESKIQTKVHTYVLTKFPR